MLNRAWLVVTVGLLVCTAGSGYGQQPAEEVQLSGEQLYEVVNILWITRTLQLSAEQIAPIMRLVQAVNEQQQQSLSNADNLWQQHQESVKQVVANWIAGSPPTPESLASAQQAATGFWQERAELDRIVASSIPQILLVLRPDQRSLVESLQQQQQRRQMTAQLEGAGSVAEYIVRHLAAQRELMPDEYELVRGMEARRLAAKLVHPRAPSYAALTSRILQLTDTAYQWPQETYNAEYPTLADQVAQVLNLPPATVPPISYDDLVDFVSSAYTAALLQHTSPALQEQPAGLPAASKPLADHPLAAAVDKSDILALFNSLQLFPQQLPYLLPLAQQGFQAVQTAQEATQDKYEAFKLTLQQAYQLLIASGQMPPEVASALAAMRDTQQEARHQQRIEMVALLRRVETILVPEQNALIDWQLPADLRADDPAQWAAYQRQLAAEMIRAIRFLELLRYRDPFNYIQSRMGEVERYLSNYVDPRSPVFPRLRGFIIDLLDRMKMVEEPDWANAGPQLAAELVDAVGALPGLAGPHPTDQPVCWEDLYQVFTSPYTSELLQKMLAARSQAPAPIGGG